LKVKNQIMPIDEGCGKDFFQGYTTETAKWEELLKIKKREDVYNLIPFLGTRWTDHVRNLGFIKQILIS
jgi:hypothetical protein